MGIENELNQPSIEDSSLHQNNTASDDDNSLTLKSPEYETYSDPFSVFSSFMSHDLTLFTSFDQVFDNVDALTLNFDTGIDILNTVPLEIYTPSLDVISLAIPSITGLTDQLVDIHQSIYNSILLDPHLSFSTDNFATFQNIGDTLPIGIQLMESIDLIVQSDFTNFMADVFPQSLKNPLIDVLGSDSMFLDIWNHIDMLSENLHQITSSLNLQIAPFLLLHDFIAEKEDTELVFSSIGWPVAPSMSRQLIQRIIQLYHEGKTSGIPNTINHYYCRQNHRQLVEMIHRWKKYAVTQGYVETFDQSLWAYQNKMYALTISGLVPIVEGIMRTYIKANPTTMKFETLKKAPSTVIGDTDLYPLSIWPIPETLLKLLDDQFYKSAPFDPQLKKSMKYREVTRHTVSHGITVNNQMSNALKCFLIIDALLDVISSHHD